MKADGDVLKAILNNRTDSTRSIEEHEPFNTKLFAKAKDLATKEEELIEEIAKLRRETPGNVVEGYKGRYKEVAEGDEMVLGGLGEGHRGEGVRLGPLERQDKIEKSWEGGVGGLERMVKTLPETVAKKERAERVEGYVVSGDRR
jgi:kinetochor protein Mis14/NSL1